VGLANRTEPRYSTDAGQTRLGLDMTRETSRGDVFVRVEGDFKGGPENAFRLRHAYGLAPGGFLFGQTWTTLADVSSLPLTVDFEGPNSAIAFRKPLLRYSWGKPNVRRWALGVESPEVAVSQPDSFDVAFQSFPDVILRMRTIGDFGHLQFGVVLRTMTYKDSTLGLRYAPGGGFALSGIIGVGARNTVYYQITAGSGIASYLNVFRNRGFDLIFDPTAVEFVTPDVLGGYVSIKHQWADNWESNIVVGAAAIQNFDFQPGAMYSNSEYVAINLFTQLTPGAQIGFEYLFGRRENKNGQNGNANRVQFGIYYDF
jgi:hypothetical protein